VGLARGELVHKGGKKIEKRERQEREKNTGWGRDGTRQTKKQSVGQKKKGRRGNIQEGEGLEKQTQWF